jgi:hypothetical protein
MTDANTLLEDAAKAILRSMPIAVLDYDGLDEQSREDLHVTARAALAVAIEQCAKVADAASIGNGEEYDTYDTGAVVRAKEIASAIRALLPPEKTP